LIEAGSTERYIVVRSDQGGGHETRHTGNSGFARQRTVACACNDFCATGLSPATIRTGSMLPPNWPSNWGQVELMTLRVRWVPTDSLGPAYMNGLINIYYAAITQGKISIVDDRTSTTTDKQATHWNVAK